MMSFKTGVELIAEERQRQIEVEGWTPVHDDAHIYSQLVDAAICYIDYSKFADHLRDDSSAGTPFINWPFDMSWWKPGADNSNESRIRELVKAGALVAAEIDRLKRAQER